MKHLLSILTLALICTMGVFAQDAPALGGAAVKPAATPAPPASVTLAPTVVQEIVALQKDAQLAALQVENLQLKLQQAQAEVEKLKAKAAEAAKAADDAVVRAASKAGIPPDQLSRYVPESDGKGGWVLRRNDGAPPKP